MKNTFVAVIGIVVCGLSLFSSQVFAEDKKDVNQVKNCLAMVFSGQMDFHKKNARYAKNLKELDLKKGAFQQCTKVELDFSKVENGAFTVLATSGDLFWSIDDEKNMIQLR